MTARTDTRAGLLPRQQRAVVALLQTRNIAEASAQTGIPTRTMYRWLREEPFRLAVLAAEGEAIDAATRRLVGLQTKALDVLDGLLDAANPPAIRLRAAQSVLDILLEYRELRNLEERLSRLEAALDAQTAEGD